MPENDGFPHHSESSAALQASAERAFLHLDDFRNLSAHMEKRSGMMMGSRMAIETDELKGRAVGSKVRMAGTIMGIPLSLEEVVTLREPPLRKAWETTATRLLVIGDYRLGFELTPRNDACVLRVFIDYRLPRRRWLGLLFAGAYARWCTKQMTRDAVAALGAHRPCDPATASRGG